MSNAIGLAPHELLEIHEIIRSEVTCLKKIQASLIMVTDEDLKKFMQHTIQLKTEALNRYQEIYDGSIQQH